MATTAARQETTQIIRAMDEEFLRNMNAGKVGELVSSFYAEDADLLPPGAPLMSGHEAIRGFWQGMVSAGLHVSVLEASRVEESGDLAYARGIYELTVSPAGGATISDNGKYIVVYRRQPDGTWRAVADIFNSSRPSG